MLQWAKKGKKVVIFIDELDRLLPDEMLNIFKLIKAYLDFPGIFFVVALDYGVAKEALNSANITKPSLFIDKIFQASYTICSERQFASLTKKILIPNIPAEYAGLKKLINVFFLGEKDEQLETDRSEEEIARAYSYMKSALVGQFTNPRSFIRLSQYIITNWPVVQNKLSNFSVRDIHAAFAFFLLFYVKPALINSQYIGVDRINSSIVGDQPQLYDAVSNFITTLLVQFDRGTLLADYTEEFSNLIISIFQGYADMRIDGVRI